MPIHVSTIKRQRQAAGRRQRNRTVLSRLKTLVKKARTDLEAGAAEASVRAAESALHKAAGKRLIRKKKASRLTSRLSRRLTSAQMSKTSKPRAESAAGAAENS